MSYAGEEEEAERRAVFGKNAREIAQLSASKDEEDRSASDLVYGLNRFSDMTWCVYNLRRE